MSGFVFVNGRIVAARSASVSVFDRGLLYGDGLFETVRTYRGKLFVFDRHLQRFQASARYLEIPLPEIDWTRAISELLRRNRLARADAWVRITVTRGSAQRGLALPARAVPTCIITAGKVDAESAALSRRGLRLWPVPYSRDPHLCAHKTLSYLPGILAKAAATRAGADEALFTRSGSALETPTANLFVWTGEELRTPRQGVLPGITRSLVIELARAGGCVVRERSISTQELATAKEAFITSSVVEIVPILAVGGTAIGKGRSGALTRRLQRAFADLHRNHQSAPNRSLKDDCARVS